MRSFGAFERRAHRAAAERAAATQSRRLQKRVYLVARLSILHAGYATSFGNAARKNHFRRVVRFATAVLSTDALAA